MSAEQNKELVRRHFEEIYNRGNLAFADECCTPGYLLHDPVRPDTPAGPEGMKDHGRWAREVAPDIHFEVEDVIAEGDRVAVRYRFTGTHRGTLMGIPATGKFATMTGVTFYRMESGRIAEAWLHWDVLAALRAMDVQLPGAAPHAAHA
jgi:steroid delta-isomerase-like uncharacterized protein